LFPFSRFAGQVGKYEYALSLLLASKGQGRQIPLQTRLALSRRYADVSLRLVEYFRAAIHKAGQICTELHLVISCITARGFSRGQMQLPLHSGFHLNHRRNGGNLKQRKVRGRSRRIGLHLAVVCGEKQAGNGMVRALSLVAETFFNLLKLNRLVESLQSSCVSSSRKPLAATRWPGSVCARRRRPVAGV